MHMTQPALDLTLLASALIGRTAGIRVAVAANMGPGRSGTKYVVCVITDQKFWSLQDCRRAH